jgi:hypothetical protein
MVFFIKKLKKLKSVLVFLKKKKLLYGGFMVLKKKKKKNLNLKKFKFKKILKF